MIPVGLTDLRGKTITDVFIYFPHAHGRGIVFYSLSKEDKITRDYFYTPKGSGRPWQPVIVAVRDVENILNQQVTDITQTSSEDNKTAIWKLTSSKGTMEVEVYRPHLDTNRPPYYHLDNLVYLWSTDGSNKRTWGSSEPRWNISTILPGCSLEKSAESTFSYQLAGPRRTMRKRKRRIP